MNGKKRFTVRVPQKLADMLAEYAANRGLTLNSLISEIAWEFVSKQKHYDGQQH